MCQVFKWEPSLLQIYIQRKKKGYLKRKIKKKIKLKEQRTKRKSKRGRGNEDRVEKMREIKEETWDWTKGEECATNINEKKRERQRDEKETLPKK
jgi:hypothetical protein